MSIDPHRLMVLRAVRRTGGVLAAAQALHLTASGVSQHLTKLEAETGLDLVDRTRRGGGRTVRLTAAGLALSEQAEHVAAALAAAEREADTFRARTTGALRIGGFASVLNQLVAPVVMAMAITEPAIEPHIYETEEDTGLVALLAGRLDLLLSERRPPDEPARPPGLLESDLMRDPYRIVVPTAWPTTDNAQMLLSGPWVVTDASRRTLQRLCEQHGVTLDARHVGKESSTMLALVAAGLGAAVIPEMTLAYQPRAQVRVTSGVLDPGGRILTTLQPTTSTEAPATTLFLRELQRFAATRRVQTITEAPSTSA